MKILFAGIVGLFYLSLGSAQAQQDISLNPCDPSGAPLVLIPKSPFSADLTRTCRKEWRRYDRIDSVIVGTWQRAPYEVNLSTGTGKIQTQNGTWFVNCTTQLAPCNAQLQDVWTIHLDNLPPRIEPNVRAWPVGASRGVVNFRSDLYEFRRDKMNGEVSALLFKNYLQEPTDIDLKIDWYNEANQKILTNVLTKNSFRSGVALGMWMRNARK